MAAKSLAHCTVSFAVHAVQRIHLSSASATRRAATPQINEKRNHGVQATVRRPHSRSTGGRRPESIEETGRRAGHEREETDSGLEIVCAMSSIRSEP